MEVDFEGLFDAGVVLVGLAVFVGVVVWIWKAKAKAALEKRGFIKKD